MSKRSGMIRTSPSVNLVLRALSGLVLALFLALAGQPLRAQFDTRLQAGNTDFLDLYQQSTSASVKPEIATIFTPGKSRLISSIAVTPSMPGMMMSVITTSAGALRSCASPSSTLSAPRIEKPDRSSTRRIASRTLRSSSMTRTLCIRPFKN